MSVEACPRHELLAARGLTSARATSGGSSRKSASGSNSSRTVLPRQESNRGGLVPWSGRDGDGEWTDYLPSRKASDSASSAGRHQGLVQSASSTQVSERRSRQRQPPHLDDMAEGGDVDGKEQSPPDDKEDENVEGEDAGGVASSEGEQLLSASKDDVGSPEAGQGAVEKSSEEVAVGVAGRYEMGDMFERLHNAHHAEAQPNAIVFSVQQENDRWLLVFLVAGLYVFFYAIGGLAYYLLDEYGYTVAYSGRTNLSNGNSEEPLSTRRQ